MAGASEAARFRLDCPRCAGSMSALDGAAALACPHCGEQYFLGADGNVGWLVPPRLHPSEALDPAKRWLRAEGRRVTRMGEPRGVLAPLYWIRGLLFLWEYRQASDPHPAPPAAMPALGLRRTLGGAMGLGLLKSLSGVAPLAGGGDEGGESHGSVRAYAGAFPGHPLGRLWSGKAVRFAAQPLELLDPDELPADYALLAPSLSPADAEAEAARWVTRRRRAAKLGPDAHRASEELQRRLNLVAAPLILVPYGFRDEEEGAVVVDALTGRVRGAVTGAEAQAGEEETPPSAFAHLGAPALLPLECSECGWELTLRERDRLHPCPGCGWCWELVGSRRRRVRQWFLDARPGSGGRWLPFWVFARGGPEDVEAEGTEAVADLPPAHPLFVPAYSGRHLEDQMLLAAQLTRTPPTGDWIDELEEVPGGAEVGSAEAVGWKFAVEGALARRPLADFLRFVAAHQPGPEDGAPPPPVPDSPAGLVWLAFRPEGGDLVETATGARVRAAGVDPWEELRAA